MTIDHLPGTVAVATVNRQPGTRVMRVDMRHWQSAGGNLWHNDFVTDVRPLVVVDPEDDTQIDQLCKFLVQNIWRAGDQASAANGIHPFTVRNALRRLLAPPRPEPTGLGAVVVDTEGDYHVYTGVRDDDDQRWWYHGVNRNKWPAINAYKTLSEGITP